MKQLSLVSCLFALLAIACSNEKKSANTDTATVDTTQTTTKPVDSATVAKAWEEYMKPGDMHAMLASFGGKWNVEMSFYTAPNQPPTLSKAVAEYKMIYGGRYQQCNYSGQVMGAPFEGENTVAYDNARKVFVSTWIDNMGSGMLYTEGVYDPATKTINYKGKSTDVPNKKEMGFRETHTFVDSQTQTMEMFDIKDGKETKTMSIKMTRINR